MFRTLLLRALAVILFLLAHLAAIGFADEIPDNKPVEQDSSEGDFDYLITDLEPARLEEVADSVDGTAEPDEKPALRLAAPIEELPAEEVAKEADSNDSDLATERREQNLNESSQAAGEFTRTHQVLHDKITKCLEYYRERPENAAARSPWGIMHAMIAYGAESEVYADGRKINAISWLNWNGPCRGMRLFRSSNGGIYGLEGPGLQGHSGQYLAMLAQCKVKSNSPMLIDGKSYTVADLIETEMATCKSRTELTFKLIGLSHYLRSNVSWRSQSGESWDIQRLIKEELANPVIGAACGGTHRMMGFSYAVHIRQKRGEPIDGQWLRAKTYVDDYHEYTLGMQNPDGSFSTNFFEGRGNSNDINETLRSTGHILEWLAFSLPEEQLRDDPRLIAAATFLVDLMLHNSQNSWEVGPKGHAIRALVLYKKRIFGDDFEKQASEVAKVK